MRKHIFLFFSALLFLFACNQADDTKGIIKQDEMTRLLTDVHLVDGSLALQPNGDSLYKFGTGRYFYVFKQYHTDSGQFKKSVKYYSAHPEILLKIYDGVNTRLKAKADSMNALVAKDNERIRRQAEVAQKRVEKLRKDSLAVKLKTDKLKLKKDSLDKKKIIKHKKKKKLKKITKPIVQ
ncbi:MAG: hypothetical protein JWQ34_1190 [Mucilaginibacter sp.]|uniref:DUF4296 domain-containing protein n=1 Tax=Mucilaginibacter sp. TaxID=1882438 RepID=UPI002606A9F5|nr:DUF4296 domain-containing protein [Mucilaginibacter sp.]MDB5002965.1 hypothetical protein [Mucilaginibacter sp.]